MPDALDPVPLLRYLSERGVEHIVIGGFAVSAHGHVRPSKDLDIVPSSVPENLERLAAALRDANAVDAELSDFDPTELPMSALRTSDLAQGGNFRLATDFGDLDIMQWVSGIEADDLYSELRRQAIEGDVDGIRVSVCGLEHLRAMKARRQPSAGSRRPQIPRRQRDLTRAGTCDNR
jgi:hypothetical protein